MGLVQISSVKKRKKRKICPFKTGERNPKKVRGDGKGVEREIVLQLVEKLRKKFTVSAILSVLNVPRANYYRWVKTLPWKSLSREETIIISLCKKTKYRYGHRKIKALLWRQHQVKLNRNTVQRLMQKHHLQCRVKPKKRWKSQGETIVIAPNLLQRNFWASAPNQKWVTDITYIQYGSSTLYLSTVMDLYNNEIVAYKLYTHQQTPLVMDTLKEALARRGNPQGVILHSDQGSVYTSYAYQNFVKEEKIISSMSRSGNCLDNAVIESFHSNLKSEFQYVKFNSLSLDKVREQIDHYIKYYNEERIQEKLGYHSPIELGQIAA